MPTVGKSSAIAKIGHVIVIYQENWSFDSLYGKFPGANGLDRAKEALAQVDKEGKPYPTLPAPLDTTKKPVAPDPLGTRDEKANDLLDAFEFSNP